MQTATTTSATDRPEIVTTEMLEFLDDLREEGSVNMVGAGPELQQEFGLGRHDARAVNRYWMKTFGKAER